MATKVTVKVQSKYGDDPLRPYEEGSALNVLSNGTLVVTQWKDSRYTSRDPIRKVYYAPGHWVGAVEEYEEYL